MKHCIKHINELHAMIKRKGMGNMVIQDSTEADWFAKSWLAGTSGIEEIDPLVVSVLEIQQKAYTLIGEAVNKPDVCPLCAVEKLLQRDADEEWIDNVTDAVLAMIMANGVSTAGRIVSSNGQLLN